MSHTTKKIVLKGGEIAIDDGIVPVVAWLDSLSSVQTLYSCEGSDGPDESRQPYVSFLCPNSSTLLDILGTATLVFASCMVDIRWESREPAIRYTLFFHQLNGLKDLTEELEKRQP